VKEPGTNNGVRLYVAEGRPVKGRSDCVIRRMRGAKCAEQEVRVPAQALQVKERPIAIVMRKPIRPHSDGVIR
jgi:hypothetical protein